MNNLIDLHTHSVLSTHAFSTVTENIAEANKKGLKYYGLSEHQYDDKGVGCHHYATQNLDTIPSVINGTHFLRGLEFNIQLDGSIDTSRLRKEHLDYGIASMHSYIYHDQGIELNTNAYLKAMDNEFIKIMGHIDDGHYPCDYEKIIKKCKDVNKLIEINNSSLKPLCNRINGKENYEIIIELCKKYEVPVIINSDAHICYDVGSYELAYDLLMKHNYPLDLILNFNEELILKYFY